MVVPTAAISVAKPSKPLSEEQLAFCALTSDTKYWNVFVAQADGQNVQRYDNTLFKDTDVACWKFSEGQFVVSGLLWSPKGDSLFATIGEFVSSYVIQIMVSPDLHIGWSQFTIGEEQAYESPQLISMSPRGDAFAFMALPRSLTEQSITQRHHIFVSNIDGTQPRPLTGDILKNIEPVTEPSWSPDGQDIAFAKLRPHNGLGIAKSNGSRLIWLTDDNLPNFFPPRPFSLQVQLASVAPVWYRDSSHLLFLVSLTNDQASALYRVTRDGADLTKLTDGNTYSPAISSDGARLVFVTYDDENSRNQGMIIMSDVSAQNRTEIVRMQRPANQKMLIRDLAWSRDGTRLAFAANPQGNLDLFVVNTDGTDLRTVTNWPGDEMAPRWRPRP